MYSVAMLYRLYLLRDRGGLIPKWQRATHRGVLGQLTLDECRDPVLNRMTRVAELLDPHTGAPLPVAPLRDVQLIRLTGSLMVLSGTERVEDERIAERTYDVAQTWWLEAAEQGG